MKIICGDAIEEFKKIPDNSIDLIITSPPYNLGGDFHTMSKGKRITYGDYGICKDNLSQSDYEEWQTQFLDLAYHKIKENGNVFYNHKNRLANFECISPLKWIFRSCFTLRQEIIWDTTNEIAFDKRRLTPCHEKVFWLSKSKTFLNNAAALSDCWVFRNKLKRKDTGHPATFPIELVERIFSLIPEKRGMLVCDPFMGSGTVGIACSRRIDVDFLGIEINEDFVKIAKERIGIYGQEKGI
jgi:site-specific DNA-methyltransferase (adenine-specific)